MDNSSGVGVIDKSVLLLDVLESGPANLNGLVELSGLPRPTVHRLALALEHHGLVARDNQGRFTIGPRISEFAASTTEDRLIAAANPILIDLRDRAQDSTQLYRRNGDQRVCIAVAERASGLRDTVPLGSALPMTAGSAAQASLPEPASRIIPAPTVVFDRRSIRMNAPVAALLRYGSHANGCVRAS